MCTASNRSIAHRRAVFAFLYSLSRDRALAEDLTQDTFVKATRALAGFRDGSPRGWLLTIARSVFLDHVRRRRPAPAEPPDREGPPGPDVEELDVIESILARLPDRQSMALLLVDHAGLSYAEMATTLGITTEAATGLLHRARRAFRTAYQEVGR